MRNRIAPLFNRLNPFMGQMENALYVEVTPPSAQKLMVIFYQDCGRCLSEPIPVSMLRSSHKFRFDPDKGTWSWEGYCQPRRTFQIGYEIRRPTRGFVTTGPFMVYDAANPDHCEAVEMAKRVLNDWFFAPGTKCVQHLN